MAPHQDAPVALSMARGPTIEGTRCQDEDELLRAAGATAYDAQRERTKKIIADRNKKKAKVEHEGGREESYQEALVVENAPPHQPQKAKRGSWLYFVPYYWLHVRHSSS